MRWEAGDHLVVIDMQEGFMDGKPQATVARVRHTIADMVSSARRGGAWVTFTRFPEYGPLLPGLEPESIEELVTKHSNDAFTSQPFRRRVFSSTSLHITGCNLEYCVRETVRTAVSRGHEVVVYQDAVMSLDEISLRVMATALRFLADGVKVRRFSR